MGRPFHESNECLVTELENDSILCNPPECIYGPVIVVNWETIMSQYTGIDVTVLGISQAKTSFTLPV